MDWVPVWTAGITATATLGGVALTQAFANVRESKAAHSRRQDQSVADLRVEARRVSDLFYEESINYDRVQLATQDDSDFGERYGAYLYDGALSGLAQAISMVPDADARAQLLLIVRNLPDSEMFPSALLGTGTWQFVVPILLNTGAEISSSYARGETPELDELKWYRRIEAASAAVEKEMMRARARHPSELGKQLQKSRPEEKAAD